jgi:nucleolar pre-ribosomal-associated protein 2
LVHSFLHTNIDQPPQKAYISDAFSQIKKKIKKANEVEEKRLNYALVMIFGVALSIFHTRANPLNDLNVIPKKDLEKATKRFKEGLLDQLKRILCNAQDEKPSQSAEQLSILSIIDALSALGVDSSKVAELGNDATAFCASVQDTELHIGKRLETFMAVHGSTVIEEELLSGDVSTITGRQSITQKTVAAMVGKDKQGKLKLLDSIFGPGLVGLGKLDKLLAARQVIMSTEDHRKSSKGEGQDEDDEKESENGFDLSEAYSILSSYFWKVSGIRQFCIISETLELMLRTKAISLPFFQTPSLT